MVTVVIVVRVVLVVLLVRVVIVAYVSTFVNLQEGQQPLKIGNFDI